MWVFMAHPLGYQVFISHSSSKLGMWSLRIRLQNLSQLEKPKVRGLIRCWATLMTEQWASKKCFELTDLKEIPLAYINQRIYRNHFTYFTTASNLHERNDNC